MVECIECTLVLVLSLALPLLPLLRFHAKIDLKSINAATAELLGHNADNELLF